MVRLMIWDVIAPIMTSLWWNTKYPFGRCSDWSPASPLKTKTSIHARIHFREMQYRTREAICSSDEYNELFSCDTTATVIMIILCFQWKHLLSKCCHISELPFWLQSSTWIQEFRIQINYWGPFYKHGLTLIPAWSSNHMPSEVWDEITYPDPLLQRPHRWGMRRDK